MAACAHCNCTGRPRLQPAWLLWLAILVWLVPLGFLSQGFWPFFLLPAVAISAWAFTAVRRTCPSCGKVWSTRTQGENPAGHRPGHE
jgi:hypothetical protein